MPSRTVDDKRGPAPPQYTEPESVHPNRLDRIESRLNQRISNLQTDIKAEIAKVEEKVEKITPKVWMMWGASGLIAVLAAILARYLMPQ